MNDLLERLANRGTPVGSAELIARVEAELQGTPVVVAAPRPPRRPWAAVAAAAAVVVVATVGGAAWLLGRDGGAAALPATAVPWPEFEMAFEWVEPGQEGSAASGRLLWQSADEWRIEAAPPEGATFTTSGATYLQGGELRTLGEGAVRPPWLGDQLPPAQAWEAARLRADLEPAAAEPGHPLGAVAAVAEGMRMEFTAEGIPVLLEVAGSPTFRVLHLARRPVTPAEIAASIAGHEIVVADGIPVPSGDLVRLVEGDGYQVALIARGDCLDAHVFTPAGSHGSGGGCGLELTVAEALSSAGRVQLPDDRVLTYVHGHAEPVARVEVEFADGTVLTDEAQGGYWLLATVAAPDGAFEVRGYDGAGELLAAVEVPLGGA